MCSTDLVHELSSGCSTEQNNETSWEQFVSRAPAPFFILFYLFCLVTSTLYMALYTRNKSDSHTHTAKHFDSDTAKQKAKQKLIKHWEMWLTPTAVRWSMDNRCPSALLRQVFALTWQVIFNPEMILSFTLFQSPSHYHPFGMTIGLLYCVVHWCMK